MAWIEPAWHRDALCKEHPELSWFPTNGPTPPKLLAICARCVVRAECLADAIANDEHYGLWGGVTTRNRQRLTNTAA